MAGVGYVLPFPLSPLVNPSACVRIRGERSRSYPGTTVDDLLARLSKDGVFVQGFVYYIRLLAVAKFPNTASGLMLFDRRDMVRRVRTVGQSR